MFFLRVISFVAGSFVLFAAPFLLLDDHHASLSSAALVLGALAVLLFAAGYFFCAMFGHRSARSLPVRLLATGLIAFQMIAGAWLLTASRNAQALIGIAPLLCFSVFLFMAFVWPGESARSHRPMRRRGEHY
ncbi:MAG: hypothetical protein V4484_12875 [Pseudomonadota bacterium]